MNSKMQGVTSIVVVLIVIVAVVLAGGATYAYMDNKSKNDTKNNSSSTQQEPANNNSSSNTNTASNTSQTSTPACSSATLQSLAQTAYPGAYVNQPLCENGYAIAEMNVPTQHLNGWVVYYQAQNNAWVYTKAAQMGNPCSAELMPSGFPVSLCNQWQTQNNNNNNGNNNNNNNNN